MAKKVGNAPEHNRIRRRLREMVKMAAVTRAQPGYDYVLVARRAALAMPFADLVGELEGAMRRRHQERTRRRAGPPQRPRHEGPAR